MNRDDLIRAQDLLKELDELVKARNSLRAGDALQFRLVPKGSGEAIFLKVTPEARANLEAEMEGRYKQIHADLEAIGVNP